LQIGSKPGQQVFQRREGNDFFVVMDEPARMLYLYRTVETLLRPRLATTLEYQDKHWYWAETTGMMYILEEANSISMENATVDNASEYLEELELGIVDVAI
jgi:hypothetical protein